MNTRRVGFETTVAISRRSGIGASQFLIMTTIARQSQVRMTSWHHALPCRLDALLDGKKRLTLFVAALL